MSTATKKNTWTPAERHCAPGCTHTAAWTNCARARKPIPMEVAVAVSTERTLFVDMLATRLAGGGTLTTDELVGMVNLLKELIDERVKIKADLGLLQHALTNLISNGKGYMKKLQEMDAVLQGVPDYSDEG